MKPTFIRYVVIALAFWFAAFHAVAQEQAISFFHPAVSPSGQIAFDANIEGKPGIYLLNRANLSYRLISPPDFACSHPAWSADGKMLSYESNRKGNYDIYIYHLASQRETRLTVSDSVDAVSQWTADGHIVFDSNRNGKFGLYKRKVGEHEQVIPLTDKLEKVIYPVWSKDGQSVLFSTFFDGDMELCVADASFEEITRLTNSAGTDAWGGWSDDGQRIVFTSKRTGSNQIFMINRDGSGLKQLTHDTENSAMPRFLPGGRQIVFMSRQNGKPSAIYLLNLQSGKQTKLTSN